MKAKAFDTKDITIVRTDERTNWNTHFRDHYKAMPNQRARLAMDMATRWGMVAGFPDGEDTAGRSKLGLMAPAEIVKRSVETADALMDAIEERGWMNEMPPVEALYAEDEDD